MLSHVLRTIRRHKLLAGLHGNRVLCAVSGGPDSMALLASMWELAPRLKLHLEIATVDHGLRTEAAAEQTLVATRAAELDIPWHLLRVDVAAARAAATVPGARRGGIQEVARRLRLDALATLAERRQLGKVALGHNADDQAETVLFRILRGTGMKGLAGIPHARGPFIRPLLDVTRAEVLAYLHKRSLGFATDPSNADLRYARSRLRHQVLPLLRQENPRVDQALRSLALTAAEYKGGLEPSHGSEYKPSGEVELPAWARSGFAAPSPSRGGLGTLPGSPSKSTEPIAGGSEPSQGSEFQIAGALVEMGADGAVHIPTRIAAAVEAAAREGRGTRSFDLPGGQRLTVAYGRITMERGAAVIVPPVSLPGPGSYAFGAAWQIVVREEQGPPPLDPGPDAWFDATALSWPLCARPRRAGDRMKPRGGAGTRKLSDLLIDAKVPRQDRASLPVVTTAAGEVLLVPGLRPAHLGKPSHATARRIGLAVVPKPDHDVRVGGRVDRSIPRGNTEQIRVRANTGGRARAT